MGSSSSSSSATSTSTRDGRVAGDNGAIGISSEGNVDVRIVADEAFELGELAVHSIAELAENSGNNARETVADVTGVIAGLARQQGDQARETVSDVTSIFAGALADTQQRANSETTQIMEQAVRVGLPVLALAYVAAKVWGK